MDINAVRDKVSQLENALKRLDSVKRHLSRSASDIKTEIRANVSRNLECLRGREVSLLNEVDQVMGVKEETLHMQQARLNQALGVLQTSLRMVQDDSATEKQLVDTLEKLNSIELSPVETPFITFRGDHVGLRETILNYGRVDANGIPLATAFDDPGNPSASLPRHVEEYEDQDHHVFYKTVEEVKRGKNTASITVTIPKLSTRLEDWLQKKTTTPTCKVPEFAPCKPHRSPIVAPKRPNTLTRSGENPSPVHGMSRTSTPGSSCSLNNWLSIIKQHADLEEEHDFEIVDNSLPQKAPVGLSSHVSSTTNNEVQKDLKQWLHSSTPSKPAVVGDCFKGISTDKQMWLLHKQLRSLEEIKHSDFFQHISKEPSTWLRSRAGNRFQEDGEEQETVDFFSHIPKNMDFWLNKKDTLDDNASAKKSSCKKATSDTSKWLLQTKSASPPTFELEDVCRANELCDSFSACVSSPDCLALKRIETSPVKNPLDPTQVFKPLTLPNEEWLHPSRLANTAISDKEGDCKKDMDATSDIFCAIPSLDDSIWLSKPSSSITTQSFPSSNLKESKEETNMWLQKAQPDAASDLIEWLFVSSNKEMRRDEKKTETLSDGEEKESEGWSVLSDNFSVSSDQHESDVAAAEFYINKWLM